MPLKADKFRPARAFMVTGSKGLPPVLLQSVEQKGAVFAVLGGQPGKGSNQRGRITVAMSLLPITERSRIDFEQLPLAGFPRANANGTLCPVSMPVKLVFIVGSHLRLIRIVA